MNPEEQEQGETKRGVIRLRRRKVKKQRTSWGGLVRDLITNPSARQKALIARLIFSRGVRKIGWRRALIGLGVLCLLALAGAGGWQGYLHLQRERTVRKARMFLDAKEYKESTYWLKSALALNPGGLEASRIAAELGEASGSSLCLGWWRRVTELQPGVPENYLAWARAALRFHEVEVAEQALGFVNPSAQNTAAYFDIEARLAEALGNLEKAETQLRKAIELDPKNEEYDLRLAAIHLRSPDPQISGPARARVEQLAAKPEHRYFATRTLLQDDLARGRTQDALARAHSLANGADASFDDKIVYLGFLKQFHEARFSSYLSSLQADAVGNPSRAAAVLNWFNSQGMGLVAIDWYKSLPEATRSGSPVPATIAQSYAALREWKTVKKLVVGANWEYLEFSRLAFLARILREEGDGRGWNDRWNEAVKAAGDHPDALAILARTAFGWGWESEGMAVLWLGAQRSSNQQWALRALQDTYLAKRDTRGLLRVASRILELDPRNVAAQSNVAYYSLLLNTNSARAQELAQSAYNADPKTPATVATYAFALFRQGKSQAGLALMQSLGDEKSKDPSYALYYGLLLANSGFPEEAVRFFDLADHVPMVPEEKALVENARSKLKVMPGESPSQPQPH